MNLDISSINVIPRYGARSLYFTIGFLRHVYTGYLSLDDKSLSLVNSISLSLVVSRSVCKVWLGFKLKNSGKLEV